MSTSHPVGFRVPNGVHKFYAELAADDHRKVGEMMKLVLVRVQGVVAACDALRITPDELLERAGLSDYRTDAQSQPETEAVKV